MDRLQDMEVRDSAGEKIGTVDDGYSDTQGSYLAVSRSQDRLVRHQAPHGPDDDVRMEGDADQSYLVVPYGKDQLREGPSFERDAEFTRAHEHSVYGHCGRTGYWEAVRARQPTPAPTPEIARAEVTDAIDRGDDLNQVAVKRRGV